MPTFGQLVRNPRVPRKRKLSCILSGRPQRKAVCVKVYTTSPRKPNSAVRKVAKVAFRNSRRRAIVAIPGFGHSLSEHSVVLIRGGRSPDIPGVRHRMIRGKFDFVMAEVISRSSRRSKFGIRRPEL